MKSFFKQLIVFGVVGLMLSLLALPSQAIAVQDVVNPREQNNTWVTDSAEILQPATETQLNQMIDRLEQENGSEIAVVTVPDTKSAASPKAFATKLFNYWQIGKKDQNNGVLILISSADRRVEIETGSGIVPILPNAQVVNIIDTKMLPRFKQQDFDGGTIAGTKSIVSTIAPALSHNFPEISNTAASIPTGATAQQQPANNGWGAVWNFLGMAFLCLFFPVFLFIVMFGNKLGKNTSSSRRAGSSNSFYRYHGDSSNSGGSGYSGGSDGGGFGGGGSDGGGGGGSW